MSSIQINTSQNVNIEFELATVGERLLAAIIDFFTMGAYTWIAFIMLDAVLPKWNDMDQWSVMAIVGLVTLPVSLYTLLSETFFKGRTLGKYVLSIQVVKIDGYKASFADYFTRWMLRIADFWAISPLVGIIVMSSSKHTQRIGDLASGTGVISVKNKHKIDATILEDIDDSYIPTFPEVINLTDRDAQIIKNLYSTAKKSRDRKMLAQLREKVEKTTGTIKGDKTDFEYLTIIMKDYTHYTQNM